MRTFDRSAIGQAWRYAFLPFIFILLTACGTRVHMPAQPFARSQPIDSVYIYSFLDFRDNTFGPAVLAEFRRQFSEALDKRGVRSTQLWFNSSPVRSKIWLEQTTPTPGERMGLSTTVPVDEVIKENRLAEAQFKSNYRLIIFPAHVFTGMGSSLRVQWDLFDSTTGDLVWATTSGTLTMSPFSGSESASDNAKAIVDGIVEVMEQSGVIR